MGGDPQQSIILMQNVLQVHTIVWVVVGERYCVPKLCMMVISQPEILLLFGFGEFHNFWEMDRFTIFYYLYYTLLVLDIFFFRQFSFCLKDDEKVDESMEYVICKPFLEYAHLWIFKGNLMSNTRFDEQGA